MESKPLFSSGSCTVCNSPTMLKRVFKLIAGLGIARLFWYKVFLFELWHVGVVTTQLVPRPTMQVTATLCCSTEVIAAVYTFAFFNISCAVLCKPFTMYCARSSFHVWEGVGIWLEALNCFPTVSWLRVDVVVMSHETFVAHTWPQHPLTLQFYVKHW